MRYRITTQFNSVERICKFLPRDKKNSIFLAMVDVLQFTEDDLSEFDGKSIDGIRVVFYKHQINEAISLARAVTKKDISYLCSRW